MIDLRSVRLAAEGLRALGSVYGKRRRPLFVNHLITVRCNLACPFCYVSGPEQQAFNGERYPKSAELNTAELRDFYRQLVDLRFKLLVIVGGEPLLRTDLDDVLRAVDDRLYVSVFTNGLVLADRHELLRRAHSVFVSLDAPDEQHDRLRARPGCFDRAVAGIAAARRHQHHLKLSLMMTVTDQNVERVGDMLAFARELRLPIGFQPPSYDGQFALEGRPTAEAEQRMPPSHSVTEAFRQIRSAARHQPVLGSRAFHQLIIDGKPFFRCQYPWYVLGPVLPNGDVVACTTSQVMASLRDTTVEQLLTAPEFQRNAAAGPHCERGCRDWGIFDVSALHNAELGLADVRQYYRTFLRGAGRIGACESL
ncbi:MAG: radical SAM protein [Deltaproteobacteria bacterium]|jgi:MoaA/NifB/PqqE/SkfB family radical SAM enzyme|nr:radical SAM protein [Deltaproteobacteria bacterium]MBW2530292.1 radical SAM protein [Deltaproteobacteria bacterium]